MTTKDYAIGGERWPGLSKLVEEAGEVVQVAGKILGTGGERRHWDGTDLKPRLEQEIGDVLAACEFVSEACGLNAAAIALRRMEKLSKFRQWHEENGRTSTRPPRDGTSLVDLLEDSAYAEQARKSAAATRPSDPTDRVLWLRYARDKGYDEGFTAMPNAALLFLEEDGMVERNPTSAGFSTHWRVTEKAMEIRRG